MKTNKQLIQDLATQCAITEAAAETASTESRKLAGLRSAVLLNPDLKKEITDNNIITPCGHIIGYSERKGGLTIYKATLLCNIAELPTLEVSNNE